ncbi:MAG TPA: hypothetical protein PKE45_13845 [Caldilineaceae bacterium]|nr:hypothetical protein [Caldilineaceae bacterium]
MTNSHPQGAETAELPQKASPTNRDRAASQAYTSEYGQSVRKPASARPNAFNPLAWILEGATGLLEELRHNDLGLSEQFWVHAQAAQRETLLALRAALDGLIAQSERPAQQAKERQQRQERRGGIEIK